MFLKIYQKLLLYVFQETQHFLNTNKGAVMRYILISILLLSVSCDFPFSVQKRIKDELQNLQGDWQLIYSLSLIEGQQKSAEKHYLDSVFVNVNGSKVTTHYINSNAGFPLANGDTISLQWLFNQDINKEFLDDYGMGIEHKSDSKVQVYFNFVDENGLYLSLEFVKSDLPIGYLTKSKEF